MSLALVRSGLALRRLTVVSLRRNASEGPGSRSTQNEIPEAFTWKGVKKNYSLWPLVIIMAGTIGFVGAFMVRFAVLSPDVRYTRLNDHPHEYYRNKQFKFMNPSGIDYSDSCRAPDYRKD